MLKQRIITALILIPIVLLLLFYANPWLLLGVVALILALCSLEWVKLIPLQGRHYDLILVIAVWLGFALSFYTFSYWQNIGLVFWLLSCFAIISYPSSQKIWGKKLIVSLAAVIILPLFGQSLVKIYQFQQGKPLLLFVLLIVWSADSGAYFAGKLYGKHKMIPKVSPGKSWEGIIGALILVTVVALAGIYYFKITHELFWILLTIVTAILSVFGDLFISMLKRRCQIKDSGQLLPGHGGILDRLDSLLIAMPVFYYGLNLMELIS